MQTAFRSVLGILAATALVAFLLLLTDSCSDPNTNSGETNFGQLRSAKVETLRNGFAHPDMIYAPFCFWIWDEPLDTSSYPAKARTMAQEMLKQGLNPGYPSPRVSMAELLGPKFMAPSPSLPKDQWLSPKWFESFDAALQVAEAGSGYLGYVDEYMWPSGRAAGRIIKKHPELANASLHWQVIDVPAGTTLELPESFFTVAAQLENEPDTSRFTSPVSINTYSLEWLLRANFIKVDLHKRVSLGQTITVEHERLNEVSIAFAGWKETSSGAFTMEARLGGPQGRLIASHHYKGGIRTSGYYYFWTPLEITETLPVGTVLYVGVIPDPGLPEKEVAWWTNVKDAYAGGSAFLEGRQTTGDRHIRLSYLTKPDLMQGNWIWGSDAKDTVGSRMFRKTFESKTARDAAKGQIRITADDGYKLFVNGDSVGEASAGSSVSSYDVTSHLHSGQNVIAVETHGDGEHDGLLCDMTILFAGGREHRILSDETWRTSEETVQGWHTLGFDDRGWPMARVSGPANGPPWYLAEARAPNRQAVIRSSTLQLIGSGNSFTWAAPPEGTWWRIYSFKKEVGGDVNVLDERLAAAFIDIAHKPYVEKFGERMGRSIPGVFCDTEGGYGNGNGLTWSEYLAPRYEANTGRDVRLWMPLLLDKDTEGVSARARFDWFEAVSDLYAGYYAGVSNYLAEHGAYYIANVWEESLTWQVSCVSDYMKVQRAFSMPGTDALELRAYEVHDFKEAQSVSEFEGRRFLCEMLDAGGWNTFNTVTMKEGANAAIAWGVNHMIPPGPFMSRVLEGNVWVPDWYDENPMWQYMHLWSDFARRAMYVNSHGHVAPDVLLIHPIESVWALLGKTEKLWKSPEAGHVGFIHELYDPMVRTIDALYSEAMTQLAKHRVDYLIADRHYVNQMSVEGKELVRGEFRFKTVVLPPLVVLPLNVAQKLVEFAKAGGFVYTMGSLPTGSTDNGLYDPAMALLMQELRAQPTVKACTEGLTHELEAKSPGLTSPIQFVSGEFPMLGLHRRIDDGEFFWLANNSSEARECVLTVAGITGGASVWDCETGKIHPVASVVEEGGSSRLELAFQPHEAYWLVFDPGQNVATAPVMALPDEEFLARVEGPWRVRVEASVQPNLEHKVALGEAITGANGITQTLSLWDRWKELPKNFSGLVDYTTTVKLPPFQGTLVLDLGKVHHFAEVWVNGQRVGAKLWPSHKFPTDAFRPGSNQVRIRVGNLVNNNYGLASPSGLLGPVTVTSRAPSAL